MSQRAAIRRRRQFDIKFRHVAKVGRPVFPRAVSVEKAAQRLRDVVTKQQLMRQRKGKK